MSANNRQNRRRMLLASIGILGAAGGVCADVATAYSPLPSHPMGTVFSGMLRNVTPLLLEKSHASLLLGHYLALLFIPLGVAGVWHVTSMFRPSAQRWCLVLNLAGAVVYAVGTAYHSSFGLVATIIQSRDPRLVAGIADFFEPFGVMTMAMMITALLGLALVIGGGRTTYPRHLALLTPLPLQLGFSLVAGFAPAAVGNLLLVVGLNLSTGVFFSISLVGLWRGWWLPPPPAEEVQ